MIELVVEKYCQNCEDFEPNVISEKLYPHTFSRECDYYNESDELIIRTKVTCTRGKRCARQIKYLERQVGNSIDTERISKSGTED